MLNDLAVLVGDPMTSGKDPLRNLEEGRPSLLIAAAYRAASPDDASILEDLLPGEAWHLGIPNPIIQLLLRYNITATLFQDANNHLQGAADAISMTAQDDTHLQTGLRNFHTGLAQHASRLKGDIANWQQLWSS